jgi:hypothetical protein
MTLSQEELEKRREKDTYRWEWAVYIPLMVICIVHVLLTRSILDILVYSRPIMIAISAVLLLSATLILFNDPPRVSGVKSILAIIFQTVIMLVAMAIFVVFFGAYFYAVGASIHDLYLWGKSDLLGTAQASKLKLVMVWALPLVTGGALFMIRLKFRSIYGLSEAAIGLWVGVDHIPSISETSVNPDFILPILTASVYLIVRGFDNVHQGLTKDPKDLVATAAINWLRKPIFKP